MQSLFDFGESMPPPAATAKPKAAPKKAAAPVPTPPAPALPTADRLEAMARELEAHEDYRVLRRLVPTTGYASAAGRTVNVLILDTETTGLDHARDRIMELALLRVQVDVATGQPVGLVEVYDGLEDPGMPIPKVARDITGITDEMVRGQRLDDARVAAMLDGADLVIAHNAGFDRPFVEARLPAAAGLKWACSFADVDWTAAGRSSAKLTSLAAELGWFYDAHRAEMDCHALLTVLAAGIPGLDVNGLAHLISRAASPSYRLHATSAPFEAKDLLKTRGYRWDMQGKVWHTRIASEEAMQAECEWLAQNVYAGRPARLQWERHDATSRYSVRAGTPGWAQLTP